MQALGYFRKFTLAAVQAASVSMPTYFNVDQSSWGKTMVITGSPPSPGPTTSFNVVTSASVEYPSRGTR
jgi:hypothetical protein